VITLCQKTVIDKLLNRQFASKKGKKNKDGKENDDEIEDEDDDTASTEATEDVNTEDTSIRSPVAPLSGAVPSVLRKKSDLPAIRFLSGPQGTSLSFPESVGIPKEIYQPRKE
jgi:hypothetical protein